MEQYRILNGGTFFVKENGNLSGVSGGQTFDLVEVATSQNRIPEISRVTATPCWWRSCL
jgi:hypothetical protein